MAPGVSERLATSGSVYNCKMSRDPILNFPQHNCLVTRNASNFAPSIFCHETLESVHVCLRLHWKYPWNGMAKQRILIAAPQLFLMEPRQGDNLREGGRERTHASSASCPEWVENAQVVVATSQPLAWLGFLGGYNAFPISTSFPPSPKHPPRHGTLGSSTQWLALSRRLQPQRYIDSLPVHESVVEGRRGQTEWDWQDFLTEQMASALKPASPLPWQEMSVPTALPKGHGSRHCC